MVWSSKRPNRAVAAQHPCGLMMSSGVILGLIYNDIYIYTILVIIIWLVVWNIFIFPYIGNNHPNWLSYFSEGLIPPVIHDGNSVLSQPGQWHEVKSCYRWAQLLIHPHILQNNHNARHNEIILFVSLPKGNREVFPILLTSIKLVIHLTWLVFPKVCQNPLKDIDGSPNYTETFRWPRPKIF